MNLGLAIRQSSFASDFFPRYFNLGTAGALFGVTYTSAQALAPSATTTGSFALFNPPTSGVQLVLIAATISIVSFTAGAAGAGIGFQLVSNQQPTTTTPGNTPQNMAVGTAAVSKASVFTAGTLVGAPTVAAYYSIGAYADLAAGDVIVAKDEISGSIIVQPNSGICITSTGALVVNIAPSLLWAEIPLG
jgi:hypothetical protein